MMEQLELELWVEERISDSELVVMHNHEAWLRRRGAFDAQMYHSPYWFGTMVRYRV